VKRSPDGQPKRDLSPQRGFGMTQES